MSDGTLSVRRRQAKSSEAQAGLLGSGDLFSEQLVGVGQGRVKNRGEVRPLGDPNEMMLERGRRKRLKDYDRLLKAFKYSAALDAVLRKVGICSTTSIRSPDSLARMCLRQLPSL